MHSSSRHVDLGAAHADGVVLVTGATGLLGSDLVRRWTTSGVSHRIAVLVRDAARWEAIAHRLEKAAEERGPVSFSLGWAARENLESLEETVNRADRELIQVRVIRRPETYTRRAPAEKD